MEKEDIHKLLVSSSSGRYPIYAGSSFLGDEKYLREHLQDRKQVFLIADNAVDSIFFNNIENICTKLGKEFNKLLLDSPVVKNNETLNLIYDKLIENNYQRDSCLIALGGGSTGDLVGYAAATYKRGIAFIQIPTTLLAMVDASIGGKTAIDHPLGKNLIGAFHQPLAVFIDLITLEKLPDRELRAGLAEVLKYGLISEADAFFDFVVEHSAELLKKNTKALQEAILRSITIKSNIVQADEFETTGERALLNLGHTFGHAIEVYQEYKGYNHGEAVAIGIVMAANFSKQTGTLSQSDVNRIYSAIKGLGLPVDPPKEMQPEDFLQLMQRDKKNREGQLRLIILNAIGSAKLTSAPNNQDMLSILKKIINKI